MPVEFVRQDENCKTSVCDSTMLVLRYDGSGRRISKTRMMKTAADGDWYVDNVTHYTGIGTEVRESYFGGAMNNAKVVVNLPQGLGRYQPEDAVDGLNGVSGSQLAGYRPPAKFEWYLKNHLGSTMLVYGTSAYNDPLNSGYKGGVKAAYDYRAFGEQVDLTEPTDKVTENFTGKELDDETLLSNHGARLLDPMLGMWISVDPKRFFPSPYLYMGNGYNPIRFADLNGQAPGDPFNSPADAAYDFAKLYNGSSIISNKEYNSAIYYDSDKDVYSYTIPTIGNSRSVSATKCISSVPSGMKVITSVHTHSAYDPEIGDGNFIPSRPTGDHYNFVDKTLKDEWGVEHRTFGSYKDFLDDPAYLVAPNGTLVEYGPDLTDDGTVIQNTGIASDPTLMYNYNALGE